jgi:iron uptake system component EfeO
MSSRYTGWSTLPGYMATARAALSAARRPDGSWTPVGDLPTADRQRIDAAVSGLLEALAPIAAIGDVRREQ